MKKTVSLIANAYSKRLLALVLTFLLVFSVAVVPSGITADAAYLDEHTYDFEKESGSVYGEGATAKDSSGTVRSVSAVGFTNTQEFDNGVLSLTDTRLGRNPRDTYFVLNDNSGIYELKSGASYTISLRFKVVSNQVSFVYGNYSYPLSSQKTEVKLVYGSTTKKEIGDIALLPTGGTTFTRVDSEGKTVSLAVGQWHEVSFNFTTPSSFADGENFVMIDAKTFNGADIQFDDVTIARLPSMKLVTTKGTLAKTVIPVKIGDKIDLPNPVIKEFGTDFLGWFRDRNCTIPFTDEYVTVENCESTLYAGFSNEVFGFESYTNSVQYGLTKNNFFSLAENPDEAYSGRGFAHYHYTEEYWNNPYTTPEGVITTQAVRRASNENSIPVKKLATSTTYVLSLKYRILEGSGDISIGAFTAGTNMWWSGTNKTMSASETFANDNSNEWKEYRTTFTTPDSFIAGESNWDCSYLYVFIHAANDVYTEAYIDEVIIKEIKGNTKVKLNANGGTFDDGKTSATIETALGEAISDFPTPTREGYDFVGWAYDVNGAEKVTADVIDVDLYDNTVYAVWSRNMGFESYYYDLESENRNNYVSDTVAIVKENAKGGSYSAKLTANGSAQNVIAMNPISNKTRYLVTFYYDLKSADSDINVQFATMDYNINDSADVNKYDATYIISEADAGKGYKMGAVVIETRFKNLDADRLAMLVSGTSGDYTVYFDSIELTTLTETDGYVIFADILNGDYTASVGKSGEIVKPDFLASESNKFIGWYNDEELTEIYDNTTFYSADYNVIYAGFIEGQSYNNYTVNGTNTAVATENSNKYLKLSGSATEKIYSTTASKRYGVEFTYRVEAITANTTLTVGNASLSLSTSSLGAGWTKHYMVVTADSNSLSISTNGNSAFALGIDNLIVYEITDRMSIINFDQKDGYGADTVRVGVKGMPIDFPSVSAIGNEVCYGWYEDSTLKTPFVSNVYPDSDITLYARWAKNPVTQVNFENVKQEDFMTSANSNRTSLSGGQLVFDKEDASDKSDIYAPLFNNGGYVKLQSNTTYAISYSSYYNVYTSNAKMQIEFFTASSDKFENPYSVGGVAEIKHAYVARPGYTYITTGELNDTNNTLYIKVKSGTDKTTLKLDAIKITRMDEGRNHVFFFDDKNIKLYEADGNYGAKIEYPNLDTNQMVVEGWYDSVDFTNRYDGAHREEPVTVQFCRWELPKITFENYFYENSTSRYALGDDISLSSEEQYDTARSLKYSYNYAIKYFETPNNTAGLGRVNDNSTYKITFKYLITEAQSDVDIKFLTANLTNRWAFITNYDEATYRIYSAEIGNGWSEATVYLTTKFESIGASGLFMTFNPVVEGPTVVYIDAVELEYLGADSAVAAFIGKEGNAVHYEIGNVGGTVSAPDIIPASQFSSFNDWFKDKECTESFSGMTLTAGINYVYSGWTDKSESFDNYTYASKNGNNFAQNSIVSNSEITVTSAEKGLNGFRIGKLNNNTTYKVTFSYKTESDTTIKFATADEMNFYQNNTSYNDEGNFVKAVANGSKNTATVYLTTAFTYSIPKDADINALDNKNADYGDMLYMYFDNAVGSSVTVTDVAVKELDVVSSLGSSVLTNEASAIEGSQALRFYFGYPTQNIINIDIDGESFTIMERGIIFKNARNTATGEMGEDTVSVKPIVLENKNDKGYVYVSKTNGFNQYWDYDNKTESLEFSGYVKNFALEDARLVAARGYIKVKDTEGNVYTFYSADKKATVKEGVDKINEITTTDIHTFGGTQWSNFTIVNPKTMPYIYGRQIELLMEYAKETHKVEFVRVTEKAKETDYEIVIGDTKRDTSDLVEVENEDQYVIAVRGTKLIIKGGSDLATMQGVKDFIEYLKLKDSLKCGADLEDGYTKYGKVSKTVDDYKLTFNDDFEGSNLNANVWGAYASEGINSTVTSPSQLGGKISMRAPFDPGYTTYVTGREVEQPSFVRDGNAVVTTARINETDVTFSRMSTFWKMVYQYGIIEFKVKVAPTPVHTSLWMNGAQNGGTKFIEAFGREDRGCMTEYDLLENYGSLNNYDSAVHHWWTATSMRDPAHVSLPDTPYGTGVKNQEYTPDADETSLYDDYHIYTFLWENTGITFAFDGVKYYDLHVRDTHLERVANYIIIGTGMCNRDYGAKYDPTIHSDYYETLIDYVRIYQNEGMGSRMVWANSN